MKEEQQPPMTDATEKKAKAKGLTDTTEKKAKAKGLTDTTEKKAKAKGIDDRATPVQSESSKKNAPASVTASEKPAE